MFSVQKFSEILLQVVSVESLILYLQSPDLESLEKTTHFPEALQNFIPRIKKIKLYLKLGKLFKFT